MNAGAARRTIQDEAYKFLHWRQKNGGAVKWDRGGSASRARRRIAEKDRKNEANLEPIDVMLRRLSHG